VQDEKRFEKVSNFIQITIEYVVENKHDLTK
jgi:hypothetical protein